MEGFASMLLPFQIRALRKDRKWTLKNLAQHSGVSEKHLSYLEEAGAEPGTLKTLYKIAKAFDVAVLIEFVPFSALVDREETFDLNKIHIANFETDNFNYVSRQKMVRFPPHKASVKRSRSDDPFIDLNWFFREASVPDNTYDPTLEQLRYTSPRSHSLEEVRKKDFLDKKLFPVYCRFIAKSKKHPADKGVALWQQ